MPKRAKVFLVDRDKKFRDLVREMLADSEHRIVLEASSVLEALKKVEEARKKGINVGIIDDSLSFYYTPSDGAEIARALRKEVPNIKIISPTSWKTDWSNENLDKMKVFQIGEKVTEM